MVMGLFIELRHYLQGLFYLCHYNSKCSLSTGILYCCSVILFEKYTLFLTPGNFDFENIEEQAEGIFGGR